MVNNISQNYFKPNQYRYYHIRVAHGNEVLLRRYNLSIEELREIIKTIDYSKTYTVIGTVETVEACINYVNLCQNAGTYCLTSKEDVFDSKNTIFVNCTEYFRKT